MSSETDVSTPIVRRGTGSTATFFTKVWHLYPRCITRGNICLRTMHRPIPTLLPPFTLLLCDEAHYSMHLLVSLVGAELPPLQPGACLLLRAWLPHGRFCNVLWALVTAYPTCKIIHVSAMQDTFRDIGANDEIVQALLSIGIGRPSHIQAAAYRALSADSSYVVLADHAGVLSTPRACTHCTAPYAQRSRHTMTVLC